jgi:nitrite reductase/ring-hydroxylating ferredoxin subunit
VTTHPARPTAAQGTPSRDLDDWCPSRRTVMRSLLAIGGVTLVPGLLTACSSGDDGAEGGTGSDGGASSEGGSGGGSGGGAGGSTIPAADVAVGTAVVVQAGDGSYVVAQPTEGEFVAFDARCTHQGTVVQAADGLTLVCPNHGSEFDASADAAVLTGPATQPLAAVEVTLEGDQLVLAV